MFSSRSLPFNNERIQFHILRVFSLLPFEKEEERFRNTFFVSVHESPKRTEFFLYTITVSFLEVTVICATNVIIDGKKVIQILLYSLNIR